MQTSDKPLSELVVLSASAYSCTSWTTWHLWDCHSVCNSVRKQSINDHSVYHMTQVFNTTRKILGFVLAWQWRTSGPGWVGLGLCLILFCLNEHLVVIAKYIRDSALYMLYLNMTWVSQGGPMWTATLLTSPNMEGHDSPPSRPQLGNNEKEAGCDREMNFSISGTERNLQNIHQSSPSEDLERLEFVVTLSLLPVPSTGRMNC